MTLIQVSRLMRLSQPVGIWLLLWPCWWALALEGAREWWLYALFAIGAVVMRGAGCIINDLWDRKIDAQVERTKHRPLASGEVSVRSALMLLFVLLCIGLSVACALGWKVVAWAAASLPLVALYPLCKRITWWPQAFLGLTFNWGALLGSVAAHGSPSLSAWLLYAAGVFWTLGYDTVYAHQDAADDAQIGVKSTARRLGNASKRWIAWFYGLCTLFLILAGISAGKSVFYYAFLLLGVAHFRCQINRLNIHNPASCARIFKSNAAAGGLIFIACLLG